MVLFQVIAEPQAVRSLCCGQRGGHAAGNDGICSSLETSSVRMSTVSTIIDSKMILELLLYIMFEFTPAIYEIQKPGLEYSKYMCKR